MANPPKSPKPRDKSKKAKPGMGRDPKPAAGELPFSFPERSAGVRHQGLFDQRAAEPPRNDGSHSEFIWGATGVVITIFALIFWGFLFVLAGALYAIGVWKAPWFRRASKGMRFKLKASIDVVIAIALLAIWWIAPTPEFVKNAKDNTPVVTTSPSPTATVPAPTPAPSPSATATPTPTPSPSLSPVPSLSTRSKRSKASQRIPCTAEDRLLGKC